LKADIDPDDVTSGGRQFRVFVAAIGKARSAMVRSRVSGTTNAEDVVGQEVQRPAVGRQPHRSARVHGGTGTLARLACRQFARCA